MHEIRCATIDEHHALSLGRAATLKELGNRNSLRAVNLQPHASMLSRCSAMSASMFASTAGEFVANGLFPADAAKKLR